MAQIRNTFEGATAGATPTTGNSATGGDAIQGITVGTGNTITYNAAAATHGSMGVRFVYSNTAAGYLQWGFVSGNRTVSRVYGSCATVPTATDVILSNRYPAVGATPGGENCSLRARSDGRLAAYDAGGVFIAASLSTNPIAANTKYRFELYSTPGTTTTNGTIGYAYFLGESTTAVFSWSAATVNSYTIPTSSMRIGRTIIGEVQTWDYDTVMASDVASGFIGPETGNVAPSVTAGADQTKAVGDLVTLSCTATDPDGTVASRAWSWVYPTSGGPTITNTGSPSGTTATFTVPAAGLYVAQVLVTDNGGLTSTATQKVFVPAVTVSTINYPAATGTWTNTGGANHAASLADANTATYVESLTTASTETVRLAPMTPRSAFSMTINDLLTAAGTGTGVIRFLEGGLTVRKTWTATITTTGTDHTYTMTAAECATVTDWNQCSIQFDWS